MPSDYEYIDCPQVDEEVEVEFAVLSHSTARSGRSRPDAGRREPTSCNKQFECGVPFCVDGRCAAFAISARGRRGLA